MKRQQADVKLLKISVPPKPSIAYLFPRNQTIISMDDEKITNFCAVTSCDPDIAQSYLEV